MKQQSKPKIEAGECANNLNCPECSNCIGKWRKD
jgi:hypothetical protein